MSVTETEVRHIAALARVALSDERIAALVVELNGILVHMDVLQKVDMHAPQPVNEPASAPSVLRNDIPGSVPLATSRESFAPAFRDGFFLVPRLSTHE